MSTMAAVPTAQRVEGVEPRQQGFLESEDRVCLVVDDRTGERALVTRSSGRAATR